MSYFLLPTLTQPKPSITQRCTLTPSVKKKMKTKFQNFNLGEVEVLTQAEQSRVKGGGGYPSSSAGGANPNIVGCRGFCTGGTWPNYYSESLFYQTGAGCGSCQTSLIQMCRGSMAPSNCFNV